MLLRRFVDVHFVLVELLLAEKREKDQAEHVERSEPGGDKSEQPQRPIRMRPDALPRISSLLKNPAKPGTPEIANVAMNIVQNVTGMALRRPPILRMSCSPPIA